MFEPTYMVYRISSLQTPQMKLMHQRYVSSFKSQIVVAKVTIQYVWIAHTTLGITSIDTVAQVIIQTNIRYHINVYKRINTSDNYEYKWVSVFGMQVRLVCAGTFEIREFKQVVSRQQLFAE